MNIVIVELRNEILASDSPVNISVDALTLKYPKGTIYINYGDSKSWYVVNRGSPVKGTRFSSSPRAYEIPNVSLPEIVRLASMMSD